MESADHSHSFDIVYSVVVIFFSADVQKLFVSNAENGRNCADVTRREMIVFVMIAAIIILWENVSIFVQGVLSICPIVCVAKNRILNSMI